jgi:hypothetical protein
MSMTNEELVRKSVITTDAIASSGKLNDAQADKFLDYVVDLTGMKQYSRVVRFRNENMVIDKIAVNGRVAMPAVEARDPGKRRGVTTSKIQLTPKEIIVPFEIGDTFKEINLEGESVEDHIVGMMGRQTGNDIEDLYINGNEIGPAVIEDDIDPGGSTTEYVEDSFLAMIDGWLTLADSGNLVDAAGANISSSIFSRMINALPEKFKRDLSQMVFLCSTQLEQLWRERVSTRATGMGDRALASREMVAPFGIPLVGIPLFSFYPKVVEEVTFTGSGSTVALSYGPIVAGSIVVTPSTLGAIPTDAYILTTDYTVNETTGTITHAGGGSAIGTTATVKVTYQAYPQVILTRKENLIVAIGRDIRIEKDRDIYKRVNQYAITCKVDVQVEEVTALVKAYNIGNSI